MDTKNGNFVEIEEENQYLTLIAFVYSKGQNVEQKQYVETFKQVANNLNWKLILEKDDDGSENIKL